MTSVRAKDIITIMEVCRITGVPQATLRKWRDRRVIPVLRGDLNVLDWSKVRPVIAARLGMPADSWSTVVPGEQ